jgi:hypothetical protein
MPAQLRLLNSDGVSPFVSHNYGNVLAGAQSVPKLVFVDSYGDVAAEECEFGVEEVVGNDGYTFTEISLGASLDAGGVTVTGAVVTTGGSINAGASISYKVAVADRWGNISAPTPAAYTPAFASGSTNKCDLAWTAVAGAFKYIVYSDVGGSGFYKVAETPSNSYTDLSGTNDGINTPAAPSAVAYVEGTWQQAALILGTMSVGAKIPLAVRSNVPAGITSANNPRQFKCYVAFLAA